MKLFYKDVCLSFVAVSVTLPHILEEGYRVNQLRASEESHLENMLNIESMETVENRNPVSRVMNRERVSK